MMALLFGLFLMVACGVVFGEKKYMLAGAYVSLAVTARGLCTMRAIR